MSIHRLMPHSAHSAGTQHPPPSCTSTRVTERRSSSQSKDLLIKNVSTLLAEFAEERDRGLREIAFGTQQANEQGSETARRLQEGHIVLLNEAADHRGEYDMSLKTLSQNVSQGLQTTLEV